MPVHSYPKQSENFMSERIPMPMPFGWFQVAYSHELGVAESMPLRYFDTAIAELRAAGVDTKDPRVWECLAQAWDAAAGAQTVQFTGQIDLTGQMRLGASANTARTTSSIVG